VGKVFLAGITKQAQTLTQSTTVFRSPLEKHSNEADRLYLKPTLMNTGNIWRALVSKRSSFNPHSLRASFTRLPCIMDLSTQATARVRMSPHCTLNGLD
jgi:hypothetical protein